MARASSAISETRLSGSSRSPKVMASAGQDLRAGGTNLPVPHLAVLILGDVFRILDALYAKRCTSP